MLAAPEILNGNHVLCGAETGSGKTLAYLAPVMQQLKDEEETVGTMARVNRPRAIILCPSRELALQVLGVAKSLCHGVRLRIAGIIGGKKRVWQTGWENAFKCVPSCRELFRNPCTVQLMLPWPPSILF